MAEVATTKIFENDKIAVWELVLDPGESTGVHTHSHDYMYYAIEGSTLEVTDKDENVLSSLELNAGDSLSFRLEGDELVGGELRVPATHNARNIGTTRFREILVETK